MQEPLSYALVTPARNEAAYIGLTLESMVAQTHRPLKWVIVSDGSTDGTDEIVLRYQSKFKWIELLRMPERAERHFAGKVHAFNAGYEHLRLLPIEVIGNLDADVSFEPGLFELLMLRMAQDGKLGVAGVPFREGSFQYDYQYTNIENVWGGCQMFRRTCFEDIGGYMPLEGGCIDHVAVLAARMHGWKTRTFTEFVCLHHRQMGTALHGLIRARMRVGQKDYSVGNHPLWQLFRTVYQMSKPPLAVGGLAMGWGYLRSFLQGAERPLPKELIAFVRAEQIVRLKRLVGLRPTSPRMKHA
jgi:glycosyltransferase involved in cell wall biosynthesis